MKKFIAAISAVFLLVSLFCFSTSAYESIIRFHVGESVVLYDGGYYAEADSSGDYPEDLTPLPESDTVYYIVYYDMLGDVSVHSDPEGICTLSYSDNLYTLNFNSPGKVTITYTDGPEECIELFEVVGNTSGSGSGFITSFLTGLTSVFTGLTSGLAGVGVSAADSLILDAEGNLTSFSQLGIFFLAISLVIGVVFFLARRIRR